LDAKPDNCSSLLAFVTDVLFASRMVMSKESCFQCGELLPAQSSSGVCSVCESALRETQNKNRDAETSIEPTIEPDYGGRRDEAQSAGQGRTREDAGLPTHAGRYRIVGEVARGGMGAVLRAHDPELDRTLAIKIMLTVDNTRPDLEQRFLEEAKITGQLQHPAIPPVHDRGRLENGGAFFAMKLIDGRTLSELLRARTDPGQDLPRLIGVFNQVCQAIAFAHSRRILHRDLKPANIMVGSFGEVQVMDWGLAKCMDDASTPASPPSASPPSASPPSASPPSAPTSVANETSDRTLDWQTTDNDASSRTSAGTVLGTPAYIAC